MFSLGSTFNGKVNSWDTSKVRDMYRMFYKAYAFNEEVGSWSTSQVTTMSQMFTVLTVSTRICLAGMLRLRRICGICFTTRVPSSRIFLRGRELQLRKYNSIFLPMQLLS